MLAGKLIKQYRLTPSVAIRMMSGQHFKNNIQEYGMPQQKQSEAEFNQLHHTVAHQLLDEIRALKITEDAPVAEINEKTVTEIDSGAAAEIGMWVDLFEKIEPTIGEESQEEVKGMQCIKTQKRRDLKMKKHRRAKRKKVMLLKLKASGKL